MSFNCLIFSFYLLWHNGQVVNEQSYGLQKGTYANQVKIPQYQRKWLLFLLFFCFLLLVQYVF